MKKSKVIRFAYAIPRTVLDAVASDASPSVLVNQLGLPASRRVVRLCFESLDRTADRAESRVHLPCRDGTARFEVFERIEKPGRTELPIRGAIPSACSRFRETLLWSLWSAPRVLQPSQRQGGGPT